MFKSLCNSVPLRPQFSVPNYVLKGTEFENQTELIGGTVMDVRIYQLQYFKIYNEKKE